MPKNLKTITPLTVVVSGMLILQGCVASGGGRMEQRNETRVALETNNYKMLKAGVRGESRGFTLLGLIPLVSPSFADAKADLYANASENLTGRSVALANQTEDRSGLNLLIFQIPKVTITADIVEFNDKQTNRQQTSKP